MVYKSELIGEDGEKYYGNQPIPVVASSDNCCPYSPRLYRRNGIKEDPWVSLRDHGYPGKENIMVYGESSTGQWSQELQKNDGMNVFIRKFAGNSENHRVQP